MSVFKSVMQQVIFFDNKTKYIQVFGFPFLNFQDYSALLAPIPNMWFIHKYLTLKLADQNQSVQT